MRDEGLPLVACLCPTYRRPSRLLANAIACFEHQDYPAQRRRLIDFARAVTFARNSSKRRLTGRILDKRSAAHEAPAATSGG